jgi:hypothetical protein
MVPFGTAAIEGGWGAGCFDSGRVGLLRQKVSPSVVEPDVLAGRRDGIGIIWDRRGEGDAAPAWSGAMASADDSDAEGEMCRGLNSAGWSKESVSHTHMLMHTLMHALMHALMHMLMRTLLHTHTFMQMHMHTRT